MTLYGKVLSVVTENLGEPAVADAAIGASTIYVADAATFDEIGGLVVVGGETLAYTDIDVDLDTITLAVPLAAAVADTDRIEVYPPTPIKTAFVDMLDNSDFLPATVPLNLLDRLPDGTREPDRQETVELTRRGLYEYVVADVTAEPVVSQTLDFTEAEQGIGLSESVAQFQDVAVLGAVSTPQLSVDAVTLAGVDLGARLDNAPAGKLLSARLAPQGSNISIPGTSTKIFELNCGTVLAGRSYRVKTDLIVFGSGTLAISDRARFIYRYTVDGTAPTTSSPTMVSGLNEDNVFTGNAGLTYRPSAEVDIAAEATLRVGLFVHSVSGAGTYTIYAGASAESRPVMTLYDDGPSGSRNDAAITLTGGGITTFTKAFNASWALGSNGSGVELANSYVFIGADYLANYNFGLVGFDSTAIVAALTGVTTPTSVKLKWTPRSRISGAGLDVEILTHNYASSAAAKAVVGGTPTNYFDYGSAFTLQTTHNNTTPGQIYEESLGTTVFNQFKAGTRKGVGFANPSLEAGGTGSVYGDGASECQLVFTYQGTS